ncbi:hypothetical protein K3495_g16840, partial [Podosphaera aphanis]
YLTPTRPKRVKVGGGELRSEFKGVAELKCSDGSSMLLTDVLYVPKLGVNLLSVRRLCQAGLKFSGNQDKLYLLNGKRKIVTATMKNGLYIVSKIAKGYEETAFPSMKIDSLNSLNPTPDINDKVGHSSYEISDNEAIKSSDKQRYLIWHRRFAHLGPEKLRNLHKVTSLKKPIKVPRDLDICEVCALTKIRNRIPKQLRSWTIELLGRVQFDVAGPL